MCTISVYVDTIFCFQVRPTLYTNSILMSRELGAHLILTSIFKSSAMLMDCWITPSILICLCIDETINKGHVAAIFSIIWIVGYTTPWQDSSLSTKTLKAEWNLPSSTWTSDLEHSRSMYLLLLTRKDCVGAHRNTTTCESPNISLRSISRILAPHYGPYPANYRRDWCHQLFTIIVPPYPSSFLKSSKTLSIRGVKEFRQAFMLGAEILRQSWDGNVSPPAEVLKTKTDPEGWREVQAPCC